MPSERPLLTIAVPTYNRHRYLSELLEVLTPQLARETRVELIISDNASEDDTSTVVESFRRRGLTLSYWRNETNIGADANFIQCYEKALGEYVWIFGDDDIIVPGGLRVLLGHLESRRYDLLYLRTSSFRGAYKSNGYSQVTGELREFASPLDFARYVTTSLTFISANISRKAAFRELPIEEFRRLIGSNLAQLGWIFALLRNGPRCACVLDVLVAARQDNSGGIGTCRVFGTSLRKLVSDYFGVGSPMGRAILNRTIQVFFPGAMLYGRTSGKQRYVAEDAADILQGLYRDNPRYWLFIYPVLRLPVPMARMWVLAGKVINRVDRYLGYPISR